MIHLLISSIVIAINITNYLFEFRYSICTNNLYSFNNDSYNIITYGSCNNQNDDIIHSLYQLNDSHLTILSPENLGIPLWISSSNNHIIVSSDYLLIQLLESYVITSITFDQSYYINLLSKDTSIVLNTNKVYNKLKNLNEYANELYLQTKNQIEQQLNTVDKYIIELDRTNSFSLLLECIVHNINDKSIQIVYRKPLVENNNPVDNDILNYSLDILQSDYHFHLYPITTKKITIERFKLCRYAYINNLSIISPYNKYSHLTSLHIYFDNIYCNYHNVNVYYPFIDSQYNYVISNGLATNSYIRQSIDYLINMNIFTIKPFKPVDLMKSIEISQEKYPGLLNLLDHSINRNDFVILVIATNSYVKILANFLCSITRVNVKLLSNILVVTIDKDIELLVKSMNSNAYLYQSNELNQTIIFNFGTYIYQRLIYLRTDIAYELLQLGYQVIISDIDTVWISNPLPIIQSDTYTDLAVTYDNNQICGCFIVLYNTKKTLEFWEMIRNQHRQLIDQIRYNNYILMDTFDSEQTILTATLSNQNYSNQLLVVILPEHMFPSGYMYFNLYSNKLFSYDSTTNHPVVIHNNFIISLQSKINRFIRYELWFIDKNNQCISNDNNNRSWKNIFPSTFKNINIPIYLIVLPTHDTVIVHNRSNSANNRSRDILSDNLIESNNQKSLSMNSSQQMVHVMIENYNQSIKYKSIKLYIDPSKSKYVDCDVLSILDTTISHTNVVSSILTIYEFRELYINYNYQLTKKIDISIDITTNRLHFIIDYNNNISIIRDSNEKVIFNKLNLIKSYSYSLDNKSIDFITNRYNNHKLNYSNDDLNNDNITVDITIENNNIQSDKLIYLIKVITFNRPDSLLRLLHSINLADYLNINMSLEIIVDGMRDLNDEVNVYKCRQIANDFYWLHGNKTVTIRSTNYGLKRQWFHAWKPNSPNEVAFIFEDDIEVSPYYFKWTYHAIKKYYIEYESQITSHMDLYNSIKSYLNTNSSKSLDSYASSHGGEPLMYGICLQKQHLDPNHHPKKLVITNGHQPYLYSLIGSWGPLFFPITWNAFRLWWSNLSNYNESYDPYTEDLFTNQFYNYNPNIWTPWMIRFAYETGLKCLYPNLPSNLSLITNHKEVGENYQTKQLQDSELLQSKHFLKTNISNYQMKLYNMLMLSLNSYPTIERLSLNQFDFNLRKLGSYGYKRPYYVMSGGEIDKNQTYSNKYINFIINSMMISKSLYNFSSSDITIDHWFNIIELIESYIPIYTTIYHIEITPLVFILKHIEYNHIIISNEYNRICKLYPNNCYDMKSFSLSSHDILSMMILDYNWLISNENVTIYLPYSANLVIIGPCASAPTELSIYINKKHNQLIIPPNNQLLTNDLLTYIVSHDLCLEHDDIGITIWEDVNYLPENAINSRGIKSIRLQHSLILRDTFYFTSN